jgi:Concanavalin A-like lectin/glucanases superfamily
MSDSSRLGLRLESVSVCLCGLALATYGCTLLFPLQQNASAPPRDAAAQEEAMAPDAHGPDAAIDASTDTLADAQLDVAVPPNTYAKLVLADNPIAYFPMNEASGRFARNAATSDGLPLCEVVRTVDWQQPGIRGGMGGAAGLHGKGHFYCDSPLFDFPERLPYTLEIWVRFRSRDASIGSFYPFFRYKIMGAESAGYDLFVSDTYGIGMQRFVSFQINSNVPPPVAPLAEWTHLAGVMDGSNLRIYVNGQLGATPSADTRPSPALAMALTLGVSNTIADMDADIDEVAIYAQALRTDQIANHYEAGK